MRTMKKLTSRWAAVAAALLLTLSAYGQSLIVHYDLSSAAIGDAMLSDLSGHGHDAVLSGGAAVAEFKKELSLKTGTKGYLDLGAAFGSVVEGLGDFTLSTRLFISNTTALTKAGNIVLGCAYGDDIRSSAKGYLFLSATDMGVHVSATTPENEASSGQGNAVVLNDTYAKAAWHTFTWTLRGDVVRFYLDGVYQHGGHIALVPSAAGRTTSNTLFAPLNADEQPLRNTYMTDFRLYDGALSSAAVAQLCGLDADDTPATAAPLTLTLKGGAVRTETAGLEVIDLGEKDGYVDLGSAFGEVVATLDDFAVSTNLQIPASAALGNAGNFIFTFANGDRLGSSPVGCAFLGANETRYAITPTNYTAEKALSLKAPFVQGLWQNITYTQRDGLGTFYIDGLPVKQDSVKMAPAELGATTCNWLGRSCYQGDAYLRGAQYNGFSVFTSVPTDEQILDLVVSDRLNSELFLQQIQQMKASLSLPATTLYGDIDLPTTGSDGIAISWASSNETFLTADGHVHRPAVGSDTVHVVLTATFSKHGASDSRDYAVCIVPRLDDSESVRTDGQWLVAEMERRNNLDGLTVPANGFVGHGADAPVHSLPLRSSLSLPTIPNEGSYVFWTSSDPAVLTAEGNLLTYAEPDSPLAVTLTATLLRGEVSDSVSFRFDIAEREPYSCYLFAYFTGNSQSQEQIRFALSTDGFNYVPLNDGNPVVASDSIAIKKAVRDPHILRGEDGRFYMVVTDMKSSEGWSSNDGLVLLRSDDLVHWSHSAIDFPTAWPKRFDRNDLTQVWAPQVIWDAEAQRYMVYYAIGEKGAHYIIYYSYANDDFTALTEPQVLYDHGANTIDADIVWHDGQYHMFFKTEGNGNGIQKATAPSLHGPWTASHRYLQQTTESVEGSGVFPLINSDEWVLMYDCYTSGHYQFCRSSDLESFQYVCNTTTSGAFTPRHGTVIAITPAEAERLVAAWPSSGLDARAFTTMPSPQPLSGNKVAGGNPILPDFHADPEVLFSRKTGRFYIYTTTDGLSGWAGTYYTAYSSADLREWVYEGNVLDLATAQVTWASGNAWAPAIEEKLVDGDWRYYLYFSGNAGSAKQIGVATAPTPVGPFTDHGESIVKRSPTGGGQQIDVDVFTDPVSGQSYLYWGNGYMACAELEDDMVTLREGTTKVLTPSGGSLSDYAYREAPYVFYRNGLYYFLWSVDDTGSNNYHVAYGTSTSPTGPIKVAASPIVLIQSPAEKIYGTAHNSVLQIPGRDEWYIVYHRINAAYSGKSGSGYHRETCIDRLYFNADGTIRRVIPTQQGPAAFDNRAVVTAIDHPQFRPVESPFGESGAEAPVVSRRYYALDGTLLAAPDGPCIECCTLADGTEQSRVRIITHSRDN